MHSSRPITACSPCSNRSALASFQLDIFANININSTTNASLPRLQNTNQPLVIVQQKTLQNQKYATEIMSDVSRRRNYVTPYTTDNRCVHRQTSPNPFTTITLSAPLYFFADAITSSAFPRSTSSHRLKISSLVYPGIH